MESDRRERSGWWRWALLAAALVVMGGVESGGLRVPGGRSDVWSAVFLTNGQVYFGRIARSSSDALLLREVYYLQVAPNLQQPATGPTDLTLVKLGRELHGPTDEMRINREHVLFIEDLQSKSPVVQAIDRLQGGEMAGSPPGTSVAPFPAAPTPVVGGAASDAGISETSPTKKR